MSRSPNRGFTLVEVLVALMIVAIGLAALMSAVSGTARTSGYLRDKTLAQWIALNRLAEVRLMVNKLGATADTGQLEFANRTWHYDTRYFDTSVGSMKRVVVRVWLGKTDTKSNPVVESYSFMGASVATPGSSNVDWTAGTTAAPAVPCTPVAGGTQTAGAPGSPCPPSTTPAVSPTAPRPAINTIGPTGTVQPTPQ
ncbi:MAG: type II secretion system minor pseudopilin GspI [Steroidobacteraceae bacterium]